jgi:hypothetical protein
VTKRLFWNILLISVILSLLATISETLIFSYGTGHEGMTQDDWQMMEKMNYIDAINYIKSHSRPMNSFDVLKNDFSSFILFFHFLKMSLRFFIPILITAFIVAFRVIKLKGIVKESGQ